MKYFIPGILLVILLCMSLSYCSDHKDWDTERSMYVLNDSLLQKKILEIRDSNNRQIVEYGIQSISTNQLLTSKSAEIEQLKKDLELVGGKLKNVKSSTTVPSTTADTVKVPIDHVVYLKDTGMKSIPFEYNPDRFLAIKGTTNIYVGTDSLIVKSHDLNYIIVNSSTVTFYNESKFLQRQKLKALVTQDNPHTVSGKVQTYYIHPDKKWFEKWYVHVAAGAIGSLILFQYLK